MTTTMKKIKTADELYKEFQRTKNEKLLNELFLRFEDKLEELSLEQLEILTIYAFDVKEMLFQKVRENDYQASDEVLAHMAKHGDETANTIIKEEYVSYVRRVINNLINKKRYIIGYERDDLVQSGYIGFLNAINDFNIEKKTSFKIFTQFVITRYINSLIKDSTNGKKKALNNSFSYQTPIGTDSETTFEELLSADDYSPESYVMRQETLNEMWDLFSDAEKGVLIYYSEDYSYEDIGKIIFGSTHKTLEKQNKAVDNAMQRINTKRDAYLKRNKMNYPKNRTAIN